MARAPINTPDVGDRVKLRGREFAGKLAHVSGNKWSEVHWDDAPGPKICHLHELERLNAH